MQTSDWIAGGSAVIALISGAFTLFYARTQHKLNKLQVAEKEREAEDRKVVVLAAELIRRTETSWIVRTTNIGKGTAKAVTVACESMEEAGPLLGNADIGAITPVEQLAPNSYFDIKATRWHGASSPQLIRYNWNDEDGAFCTVVVKLLID
ncbi:hypothetical protein [Variovorax sp.]|uniref:hypothetical protein n=1 Tax=Variovorax sp. TaxID=1871043 RepID=UPI0025FB41D1|nr:hypothetical protein [Variovorax sp.]